jgi:hypothetical protein
MQRSAPPVALSPQEKMLMKRLTRVRALFGFFRLNRHELLDDAFQDVPRDGSWRGAASACAALHGLAAPGLRRRLRRRGR